MKSFLKKYRHLTALFAVLVMAFAIVMLGAAMRVDLTIPAIMLIACFQLWQFAMSKPRRGYCYTGVLTPEQVKEFDDILKSFKGYDGMFKELVELGKNEGGFAAIKQLPSLLKTEQERNNKLEEELKKLRKSALNFQSNNGVKWIRGVPFVTDDCAKAMTSMLVLECQRATPDGKMLAKLVSNSRQHEKILQLAAENIGLELKAALTTADIPVPTVYVPQIVELVWHYGQARQFATVYPLGNGTVKLPRLRAGEDDFGFLGAGYAGMSQNVTERKAELDLITFTANKGGGLIRIPTELEEDTFVQLGQFLARYIARQMAKMEDKAMFLADGSATYADMTGVGPYCASNGGTYLQQLAAGKTKPTDATLNDFRAMRALVNPAVLVDDPAYYLNPTLEALLVTFNTLNQPLIYRPATGGQPATLDGFPIRWIGVSQPYSTKAAAGAFLAFFGALKYWYLGERNQVRVEVSRDVFFATDELAMRALERIDVEGMAVDAMSALQTAPA